MNAVGGFVPATGTVELLGDDVRSTAGAAGRALGLGRTFQAGALFPELTVRETVEVALEARGRTGFAADDAVLPQAPRARAAPARAEADDLIDFLGLGRYADTPIAELSTGTRRIVELAGLLALDARVLCLDEPTAGVAQRETEAFGPLHRGDPARARRRDAGHRARHAAHHGHQRPGVLPGGGPGHRRRRPRRRCGTTRRWSPATSAPTSARSPAAAHPPRPRHWLWSPPREDDFVTTIDWRTRFAGAATFMDVRAAVRRPQWGAWKRPAGSPRVGRSCSTCPRSRSRSTARVADLVVADGALTLRDGCAERRPLSIVLDATVCAELFQDVVSTFGLVMPGRVEVLRRAPTSSWPGNRPCGP